MSVGIKKYESLDNALKYFKGQVYLGVPYALENVPQFKTPEQMFYWFKPRTTYVNDPKKIELFQKLPTLLDANVHGISGGGDCDCFTIGLATATVASMLQGSKFKNFGIALVGRSDIKPVHIYWYIDFNGERQYLDLTNNTFNYERYYPFKQEVRFYYN